MTLSPLQNGVLNPLKYTGDKFLQVDRIEALRDPTVNDRDFNPLTEWRNKITLNVFKLIGWTGGNPNWVELTTSSGNITEIDADSGIAIPAAGIVKLQGTGTTTDLSFTASGNTIHPAWSAPLRPANGGTGVASPTAHTIPIAEGSSSFTFLGPLTNGQLLIGSTGADPVGASVTSSDGSITVTGGAGSLSLTGTAASTSQKGSVILATNAETIAGTDTTKAVTPDDLKAKLGTQTAHSLLLAQGTSSALIPLGAATNGQIPIGRTGNDPVLAVPTNGTYISWATGAGSLTADISNAQLQSIAGVGDGVICHTAANTFTPRTITGTANQITLTNGNGVSGNPTISLPSTIYTNISFDSGTTTLSNYTEGVSSSAFTPTVTGASTAGTTTYSAQQGSFIRVGRLVHCRIGVIWTAATGTGNLVVGGLPYTAVGLTFPGSASIQQSMTWPASTTGGCVVVQQNTNTALIQMSGASTAVANLQMQSTGFLLLGFSYYT